MTLSPAETSPIVLLQWTKKAQRNPELIERINSIFRAQGLIVLPTSGRCTTLLTASQENLERQAQVDHLVKLRRIAGPSSLETIMDFFMVDKRADFCRIDSCSGKDADGLFTVYERRQLVLGILEQISVSDEKLLEGLSEDPKKRDNSNNLRYLLQSHGWVDTLTPLHVDDEKVKIQRDVWYPLSHMMPPVGKIEAYYGPEIAYYFAFLGFLGTWLCRLGMAGLLVTVFRVYRKDTVDEDEYTPFYGLICFVWAILLFRFWERKECELAYQWGTLALTNMAVAARMEKDYNLDGGLYSHRRPEFVGFARTSPVTGQPELYYPKFRRKVQYIVSAVVTSVMLSIAFWVMILSLNLQGYIRPRYQYHPFYFAHFATLSMEGQLFDAKSTWMSFIPVVLHVVCILTLNAVYRKVSAKLTDWENHETQRAHDNSLIFKRFLFEAFDCYVVLFYLAFYERDVERLRLELVTVFNIDSFRRLAMEVIVPYCLHTFDPKNNEKEDIHDLHLDEYEQFDDYMEIIIQLGYVTLFASAYPLASLIMAGAVWVEIRADIYKLTYLCRKPLAMERVHSIGMWKRILHYMIWFSCLTNCLLFGFTSDQMMHYLPQLYIRDDAGITHMVHDKGWIAILIIFGLERTLIILGLTLQGLISPISEKLAVQLHRRKYLLSFERVAAKKSD